MITTIAGMTATKEIKRTFLPVLPPPFPGIIGPLLIESFAGKIPYLNAIANSFDTGAVKPRNMKNEPVSNSPVVGSASSGPAVCTELDSIPGATDALVAALHSAQNRGE